MSGKGRGEGPWGLEISLQVSLVQPQPTVIRPEALKISRSAAWRSSHTVIPSGLKAHWSTSHRGDNGLIRAKVGDPEHPSQEQQEMPEEARKEVTACRDRGEVLHVPSKNILPTDTHQCNPQ